MTNIQIDMFFFQLRKHWQISEIVHEYYSMSIQMITKTANADTDTAR